MRERKKETKKEMMERIYQKTSILIIGLVCVVAILSVASGESRLMLFRRIGWILMPIVTFFVGLIAGIKFVYKLKFQDVIPEDSLKHTDDGVSE
ncbi:hypothetical protein AKJ51_01560 [candidate division MSBL1 archaeon SCGC-AAA382A20]|uniref:Uncharacterized protein n=1 Tax=candidate division MSBL1 archaeon SCGC-AAA382A20 TaxID=1698280 RepID=A0A133VLK4_9EURY|nr:hypothetical protein AKJ51_01560 [candidate division MSBL1 archaeon SCGC-AAA382A20]